MSFITSTETSEFIATHDSKKLHVVINRVPAPKGLILLSHGLTGRPKEFVHVMARRAFNLAGFDVGRLEYYGRTPGARELHECTLAVHGQDLAATVQHYRGQYTNLFVAGHSYGGLTMPHAYAVDDGRSFNPDAVSFWDSTFVPTWVSFPDSYRYWPESDTYSYINGQNPRMGRAMYEEAVKYAENPHVELFNRFTIPSQVVLAMANEKLGRERARVFECLGGPKELVKIEGADHEFTTLDTAEQLIEHTLRWFNSYLGPA
jgi:alpha-beta hydrolase superfamily lysophospholipase